MGLRALAYYFDRTEALVVRSVLEAEGMLAVIGNEYFLRISPGYTMALGGYRVLVSDVDLDDAIAIIEEALANPIAEGEILVVRGGLGDRISSFVAGFFGGGAPTPLRQYIWVERAPR